MENTKLFEESSQVLSASQDIITQLQGLRFLQGHMKDCDTTLTQEDVKDMTVLMENCLDIITEANDVIYHKVDAIVCDTGLRKHQQEHGLPEGGV